MSSSPSSSAGLSPGVRGVASASCAGAHVRKRERSLGEPALLVLHDEHVRAGVVELEGDLGRGEAPRDRMQDPPTFAQAKKSAMCSTEFPVSVETTSPWESEVASSSERSSSSR